MHKMDVDVLTDYICIHDSTICLYLVKIMSMPATALELQLRRHYQPVAAFFSSLYNSMFYQILTV